MAKILYQQGSSRLFLSLVLVVPIALMAWAGPVAADSFFERVGRFVGNVERTVGGVAEVLRGDDEKPQADVGPAPSLPEGLPEHWGLGYVQEPIFNAHMLVAEIGVGNPETVILVHGLGQNGLTDWLKVVPALEDKYHVVAFDLPGFGYSQKPKGRYSPTNYARLIQWVVEQTGRERVHLVGHSMGGAVALRYAASFPERVDRLVLASVAGVLQRTAFLKHTAELPLEESEVATDPLKRATSRVKSWGDSLVEVLSSSMPDPTPILRHSNVAWNGLLSDRPNINAAMALIDEDFSGAIASVEAPTLILWGTEDQVAPPRTGRMLAGRLQRADLELIQDAGHPLMRSHAQEFNQHLLTFLDGDTAVPEAKPWPDPPVSRQEDLHCENQTGRTYTGNYRYILLENCSSVTLESVHAERLVVVDSRVSLEDVAIEGDATALEALRSSVTVTNGFFSGETGIRAQNSTLDLAGVTVRGETRAVSAGEGSRFVFSVSDIHDPNYSGSVHGVYRLEDGALGGELSD